MSWDDAYVQGVAAWNVFGLPALLVALAVREAVRRRADPAAVVRRLGLAQLALAGWSVVRVVEELLARRAMGVFPSNPVTGLPGSVVALLCDLPVGLGLVRLRPWSRRPALGLAAWRTVLAAAVTAWSWNYGGTYDPTEWPRVAATHLLPPFSLLALALPATRGAFRAAGVEEAAPSPPSRRGVAVLAALALGLLVVTATAALADALGLAVAAAG